VRSYQSVIDRFCQEFGDPAIDQLMADDILNFLNGFTDGIQGTGMKL
jgi:hypothetical protein